MKDTPPKKLKREVGIRELRDHLGEYVELAALGKDIVVTDRGKPVAKLIRAYPPGLQKLIDEGLARPAERPRGELPPLIKATGSVSDLIERK